MDAVDRSRVLEWDEMLDSASYYEVLGILEIADDDAIRTAFRTFALAFHPDLHRDADAELEPRLRRIFQRGAEAYRVLIRPELRAEYDLALAKGHIRLGVASRPPGVEATVRSLDELCTSPSGKLHARNADRLISQGDLHQAKRELLLAVRAEQTPHPELAERVDALDLALFAMGS